jgi:hypothetical protein
MDRGLRRHSRREHRRPRHARIERREIVDLFCVACGRGRLIGIEVIEGQLRFVLGCLERCGTMFARGGGRRAGVGFSRVVEVVEEMIELRDARRGTGSGTCNGTARFRCDFAIGVGLIVLLFRLQECRVHLRGKFHDGLAAHVESDVAADELTNVAERFVCARERPPPGKRHRALENTLEPSGEGGGAANLRNLDDFHEEVGQRIRILI